MAKKHIPPKHVQSFSTKKKVRRHEVYLLLGVHGDFPEPVLRELVDKVVKDGYTLRFYDKYAYVDCTHYADSKAIQLALNQLKVGNTVLEATLQKRPAEGARPRPDLLKKAMAPPVDGPPPMTPEELKASIAKKKRDRQKYFPKRK